jgi:hypothetical protein
LPAAGLFGTAIIVLLSLACCDSLWTGEMQHVAAVLTDEHESIAAKSLHVEGLEAMYPQASTSSS